MPAKIRKRAETGGLTQPDQVMTGLKTTYSFLDQYKYHLVAGFVAVVVILLGISWFTGYMETRKQNLAEEFFDAFKYIDADVGEDAVERNGIPGFKTAEEKYTKLTESLQAFLDEHGSGGISDTARLALAAAKMELGNNEEALQMLRTFLEETPESSLAPIVHENIAYAHLRLGQFEDASAHFTQMGEITSNPYLKARALVHLGDLANPFTSVQSPAKDREAARKYYLDALELLPEPAEETPDPVVILTREELKLRLSLLDLG